MTFDDLDDEQREYRGSSGFPLPKPHFQSKTGDESMNFDEITLLAIRREEPNSGMKLHELECYRCLVSLYDGHRRGYIDKERAVREKRLIRARFREAEEEYIRHIEIWNKDQERIRNASIWRTELPLFAKTATDEELVNRLLDILSAMTGEEITANTIRKIREGNIVHPNVVQFIGSIMKVLQSDLPEEKKRAEVQRIVESKVRSIQAGDIT